MIYNIPWLYKEDKVDIRTTLATKSTLQNDKKNEFIEST